MKIGILTLPLHTNYGGILQAYALYTTLSQMGHSVSLIDDKLYSIDTFREKLSLVRWNIMKFAGLKQTEYPMLCMREEMKNLLPFILQYIPHQVSVSQIKEDSFDAIIVGSDQVWRGIYSKNLMCYFLDFTEGWSIKRYAYAASFGVDDGTLGEAALKTCKRLIARFDYVSTRERQGTNICGSAFGVAADWVVDPTMLLPVDNYRTLCAQQTPPPRKSLACYVLDRSEKTEAMLGLIASRRGLSVLDMQKLWDGVHKNSIEYWLNAIAHSDFVFTDSFHGTVFSILFNKPFIVCGNKERGQSRFETLLSMTGLANRMVESIEDILVVLSQNINWAEVNEKIQNERIRCLGILRRLTD